MILRMWASPFSEKNEHLAFSLSLLICKFVRMLEFPLLFRVDSQIVLSLLGDFDSSTWRPVELSYCSWTRYITSASRLLRMGVSCADTLADML